MNNLTQNQTKAAEDNNNVYLDGDTMQYGWQIIPNAWIEETKNNTKLYNKVFND